MRGFGGNVPLMYRFVRQHGLADDVTDGKNVRYIGAHLRVHVNETALAHGHTGLVRADQQAIRCATDGDQYQVVTLRFGRCGGLLIGLGECDVDAVVVGLNRHGFGVDIDVFKTMGIVFLPDLDEVTIRALHQAVHHLYHVDLGAECRVYRTHFEADNPTADDQHFFRDKG